MTDDIAQVLKQLREERGLSYRALAQLAKVSSSQIANIESRRRQLNADTARAIDRALGIPIPLLTMLVATEGDPVRRRLLLAQIGVGAGGALAAPFVLAEAVRQSLATAEPVSAVDWDAVIAAYGRQLVVDPAPAMSVDLLADLSKIDQALTSGTASLDLFRAGAGLAQVYGLWLGNNGQLAAAKRWYALAIQHADYSRDPAMRTYTRGRTLARTVYEDASVEDTLRGVDEVLALTSKPTVGAVEAYVAAISAHSLTGNLTAGRQAVADMRRVVDKLPDEGTVPGSVARVDFLDGFLECRVGSLADAERACERALPALVDWPMWQKELEVYLARARTFHGDVDGGVATALDSMRELRHGVRVIGVAVRDLLAALPAGYRSDEVMVLRGYGSPGRMPWENVR